MTGLVLDAGAFIQLERRDAVTARRIAAANARRQPMVTSAGVVGQIWRGGRGRQAPVALLLKSPDMTVVPISDALARTLGLLLGKTGTTDIVDAHVVLLARERSWPVVTSNPDDLRRLHPMIQLHEV